MNVYQGKYMNNTSNFLKQAEQRKTIVHACSSVLIRPNGIVRYMNAVMDLQRSWGHNVIFISDARPTQPIHADTVLFTNEVSTYVPNFRDGHVWLQIDEKLPQQITSACKQMRVFADLIIAHDIHSYLGLMPVFSNGIFIQHESDVLTCGSRYSFLSDEYLAQQMEIVNNTQWCIGMNVDSSNISPLRPVYTPMPFMPVTMPFMPKSKGLLYMGDATDRKGAREFMAVATQLGVTPTVITHEPDSNLFAGADVYTFGLDQQIEMYELMAQHKVAFISSKNECPGLVVLECLQFMPVVVDSQYLWTRYLKELDVKRVTGADIVSTIRELLARDDTPGHYDSSLHTWSDNARKLWRNLSA
jgi:hypothetical protein